MEVKTKILVNLNDKEDNGVDIVAPIYRNVRLFTKNLRYIGSIDIIFFSLCVIECQKNVAIISSFDPSNVLT